MKRAYESNLDAQRSGTGEDGVLRCGESLEVSQSDPHIGQVPTRTASIVRRIELYAPYPEILGKLDHTHYFIDIEQVDVIRDLYLLGRQFLTHQISDIFHDVMKEVIDPDPAIGRGSCSVDRHEQPRFGAQLPKPLTPPRIQKRAIGIGMKLALLIEVLKTQPFENRKDPLLPEGFRRPLDAQVRQERHQETEPIGQLEREVWLWPKVRSRARAHDARRIGRRSVTTNVAVSVW